MKVHATKAALLVGAAIGIGITSGASAQSASDGASAGRSDSTAGQSAPGATAIVAQTASLDEVIVTARRVEERLQDVPISITVFNQDQLDQHNVVNGEDLARYTPGLSVSDPLGPNNASFAIRGFTQSTGTAPSVGVYFADVVAPRGGFSGVTAGDGAGPGSFFDLQNVQILKGPQGTLFGRNTTGGAILLVPQKPTSEFGGYVEGSYGNYAMNREQGALNMPLSDTVRVRLAFDRESRDGYVNNVSGIGPSRFDAIDYTAVRASIVVDLAANLENYTVASFSRSNTAGDVGAISACNPAAFLGALACAQRASVAAKGNGFYSAANDLANPIDRLQQWQVVNTTTWDATDAFSIKNIFSYAQLKDDYQTDAVGTDFTFGPITLPFADILSIPGYHNADQSTTTEELRFYGNSAAGRLVWQGGFYYENSKPLATSDTFAVLFLSCTDPFTQQCINPLRFGTLSVTNGESTYNNLGVYGQGTYALTDQLKLTGGLRYSNDYTRTWVSQYAYAVASPGTSTVFCSEPAAQRPGVTPSGLQGCRLDFHQRSDAPTWLVDLDYKPMDDLLLYAKYARGYRQGSTDGQSAEGYNTFGPEKVDSYEMGVKTTVARDSVKGTFDLAAFYNDLTNQQLQAQFNQPSGVAAAGIVNAGKSRIYGFEAEMGFDFFDYFNLAATYAYLDSKLISTKPVTLVPGGLYASASLGANPGDPLPFTPHNKLSLTGTVRLPVPESVGRVSIGATYSYTGREFVSRASPFGTIQPTGLVDLNLDWKRVANSPFDLQLFVTNVTDRNYYSYVNTIYGTAGLDSWMLSPPRMYGARLRYTFGK